MKAKSRHGADEDPEFQIAPIIDVLLVLLTFFMAITSASVLRLDRSIALPIAENSQKKENARLEAVINIQWDIDSRRERIVLEEKEYPDSQALTLVLAPRAGQNAEYRAVIRASRETPNRVVQRVMNACSQAGIVNISFAALNR